MDLGFCYIVFERLLSLSDDPEWKTLAGYPRRTLAEIFDLDVRRRFPI